jgi:WD40 repeat protein
MKRITVGRVLQWLTGLLFALQISVAESQVRPELVVQTGHTSLITSVAFSPDGRTLVSSSNDNTLILWNALTGRQLKTFRGHERLVRVAVFSPDGKTLASGSNDNTIRIWDVSNGREIRVFRGHDMGVTSLAFSGDGRKLVSGSDDKTVRLWDTSTGFEIKTLKGHTNWITSVAFSNDGNFVASGSYDWSIRIWDVARGREIRTLNGHMYTVFSIAFSPDSKTLASGGDDKTLRLWKVESGQQLWSTIGHSKGVNSVAFSPNSMHLATASNDKSIRLWDVSSGREIKTFHGHSEAIFSVAFNFDGRNLASAGADRAVRLWDVVSGRELAILIGHAESVRTVAVSPDGLALAFGGSSKTVHLWDTTSGNQVMTFRGHRGNVQSVAFSSDGKTLASGDYEGEIRIWGTLTSPKVEPIGTHRYSVNSISFSPNDKTLATGSNDETLRLSDAKTGQELRTMKGHSRQVTAVSFSPAGDIIASASQDRSLRLWDASSGKELLTLNGHESWVNSVAFSPDGKTLASASRDGTLRLWAVAGGQEIKRFYGHTEPVQSLAFSPDGKVLASGGLDMKLRLWDVASAREIKVLNGHSYWIESVSFSPNGAIVFSASSDGTVKLWRVSDGKELATLISFTDGTWVVTDPEGRFDTADLESMPHLHWVMPDDPFTPVPLEAFMKDYYEPRLLARILAGETFKPVRALTSLNRTQPEVKIVSVVPEGSDPSLVRVIVSAAGATKSYLQGEDASSKKVARPTAVHDLRLFRDGQVVGYADGNLAEFSASSSPFTKTFTVRLPRNKAGQYVVFSAYAFNNDRVKSETVRSTYKAPALSSAAASSSSKGRAYVISMGVNQHENSAWNLGYAANDARVVAQRVSGDLRKGGQFAEVVPLVLVSDEQTQHASKAALRAVLARLAGKSVSPADEAALQSVRGVELLRKAQPDDLVLLSFAGHGFADDVGQFYLMAQDTGAGTGKQITEVLKTHSISSEELSLWLRDVDAGDMTMIVDACQSAASVQAEGFKPGPMGSRGLGQLSFDKGMRILAASQSDEFALEDQRLKHGLLTFSLINDGLEAFNADFEPKDSKVWLDEWLKYGVKRVPTLADEVKSGAVKVANRGPERGVIRVDAPADLGKPTIAVRPAQQPALFDFAKRRQPVVLSGQ